MSFSIPSAEDIGPLDRSEELEGPGEHKLARPSSLGRTAVSASGLSDEQLLELFGEAFDHEQQQRQQQQQRLINMIVESKRKKTDNLKSPLAAAALLGQIREHQPASGGGDSLNRDVHKLNTFLFLSGQTKSPLAGAVGDQSQKRDVISVGQCCNMVETEDVSVVVVVCRRPVCGRQPVAWKH
jgi:hypothetical protein